MKRRGGRQRADGGKRGGVKMMKKWGQGLKGQKEGEVIKNNRENVRQRRDS